MRVVERLRALRQHGEHRGDDDHRERIELSQPCHGDGGEADAACHAAQLVLLNSDFSAMPKVVAEGRRVINNIQRASALYLVKNILSFFLALITLFAAFPYPSCPSS